MVATSPIITETAARRSGGKTLKLVANTVGIMAPPRKPCRQRKMIIEPMLQAVAQAMLMTVKPVAENTNRTRVESSRARKPESGIMMTSAIRYEVCTQLISSALAASPAWISDKELETI
jgi:hypothetical protein